MTNILILIILTFGITISKYYFRRWFNPLFLYTIIWGVMLSAYELKLMPFIDLSNEAWIIISGSYAAFFLGTVLVFTTKGDNFNLSQPLEESQQPSFLFFDEGKTLSRITWFLALLGLYAAIDHWMILFAQYQTLEKIFYHSVRIYLTRIHDEDQGIPYIWLASYLAIVFAGISNAKKGKIEIVTIVAILGIVLKEMARFTRSGILVGFWLFLSSFIYYRYFILSKSEKMKKQSNRKIIFGALLMVTLLVSAAGFVKVSRRAVDDFSGTSSSLTQFAGGAFISPSIYLYISSHVAVLSRAVTMGEENTYWGQNTIKPIYNLLAKFGLFEKTNDMMPAYYIPYWTNSGSYLRDLYNDYGAFGVIWGPFLLGFLSAYFWLQFYYKNDVYGLLGLVYLTVVISMSFFAFSIKGAVWSFNLVLQFFILKFIQNKARKSNTINLT